VKVKGAEYLRVHKLISRVTPIALWEAMAAGDDMQAMRTQIPEEFWADFDSIHAILRARIDAIVARVNEAKSALCIYTDKEVGQMQGMNPEVRQFIFLARKCGDAWETTERARTALFRHTRPTGNALDGYTSSVSMNRVQAESK
jgi:RNA ligase